MDMKESIFYKSMLLEAPIGFAYHKIIYDSKGKPLDYIFLEVNFVFERVFNIKNSEVTGKRATEVIPESDWVKYYDETALTGKKNEFRKYFPQLNRWYKVSVYSPEEGYLAAYFSEISEEMKLLQEINQNYIRNKDLVKILKYKADSAQALLEYTLQKAIELSESKIGFIFFYSEEKKEFVFNPWSENVLNKFSKDEKRMIYQLSKYGLWEEAVIRRKAVVVNDFKLDNCIKGNIIEENIEIRNFLTLPVIDGNNIAAVIGVANKSSDYNQNDIFQLTILMENSWISVDRIRFEESLYSEKERLKITLKAITDGVIAVDNRGIVTLLNKVAEELTGWSEKESAGKNIKEIFKVIESSDSETDSGSEEYTLVSKNGTKRWISKSSSIITDQNNESIGKVLVFRDITPAKLKEKEILYLSYHDSLTGLYNRRFFEEEIKRLDTERQLPLAIIIGDINGLKLTNDVFGHESGDKLILSVVDNIITSCRYEDIIARWGGDEFIILLPRTNEKEVLKISSRIKLKCTNIEDDIIKSYISLGYAVKEVSDENLLNIIRKAEDSMYKQKLLESRSLRGSIIDSIKKTIYKKSHESEENLERLKTITKKIGLAMDLSEKELYELELLSMLRDIGKIGIKNSIINKSDILTEDEWTEIRKHPEIGCRIAQSSPELAQIADYILAHHERWDGNGYPRGLKGTNIPLLSRILSVADAYDSMISSKPYKSVMDEISAVKEIQKNSGIQFDPEIVKYFIEIMKEKIESLEEKDEK